MGTRATELCMEMVNDPAAIARLRGTQVSIAPELIIRASTARVEPSAPSRIHDDKNSDSRNGSIVIR